MKIFTIILLLFCSMGVIIDVRSQSAYQEMVHVQTNKFGFHAGEFMWFGLQVVDVVTGDPSPLSKIAYIEIIDSLGRPAVQTMVTLQNGYGHGHVELPDLLPGIYMLVAYTNWMKNFGEERFFRQEIAVVNGNISSNSFIRMAAAADRDERQKDDIKLISDKSSYKTREKVTLTMEVPENISQLVVSVYRVDSMNDAEAYDPDRGIRSPDTAVRSYSLAPEVNGRIVKGRIMHGTTRMPAGEVNVFLTTAGRVPRFYNGMSDRNGNFVFELRNAEDYDSLLIRAQEGDSHYIIEVEDPFFDHQEKFKFERFRRAADGGAEFINRYVDAQVEGAYRKNSFATGGSGGDSTSFYGQPDVRYQLDDYTRFSKLEEVFREYVAPVAVNRNAGKFMLRVFRPGAHETYGRAPLVLFDGYPIFDINKLFEFDPLKVKTIEVVTRRFARTGGVFDGIVSLGTYRSNLAEIEIDSNVEVVSNQRMAAQASFSSPAYTTDAERRNRLPDFRNALYWNPDVKSSQVSFHTSDVEGTFVAVVQPLVPDKNTSPATLRFEVKK